MITINITAVVDQGKLHIKERSAECFFWNFLCQNKGGYVGGTLTVAQPSVKYNYLFLMLLQKLRAEKLNSKQTTAVLLYHVRGHDSFHKYLIYGLFFNNCFSGILYFTFTKTDKSDKQLNF